MGDDEHLKDAERSFLHLDSCISSDGVYPTATTVIASRKTSWFESVVQSWVKERRCSTSTGPRSLETSRMGSSSSVDERMK